MSAISGGNAWAKTGSTPTPPCEFSLPCAIQSVVSVLPHWPKDTRRSEEPEGSGVVVHDGTLVATADHVLGPANMVKIRTSNGEVIGAEIVLRDIQTDIALLRVDRALKQFETARPDVEQVRPSDKACAIGNAFGLDLSLTCGVVSAVNVSGTGFNPIEDFIQTDAAVNPGMSGGALVDDQGRFLGMLSAIFTKQSDSNIGVNFAVSERLLSSVVADFLDNGKLDRPSSGILIRPSKDRQSAEIVRVVAGSPEERAGLKTGDLVTGVEGKRFSRPGLYRRALAFVTPKNPIRVTVQRDGKELPITIKFEN